ncbi:dihydroxyacetone kinase phosphoryl donor subunit DhaM [Gracilibacillus massiliensis]|uniref:dihydroxyacetone kinase phosphoryl donor subunit DhaM n=1 Tax=Gracilibacillus massiliensis TaxID=1564956 RepID=UPI00071E5E06|nr:dihydroxyacetone kinase phosphoryl donor subunit DhaM [Gracilibacillus massiliensis]
MSDKVGIVIISHSPKIGDGVFDLIKQVITGVPIAVAAGTDDNKIGTSMEKIKDAIEQVDSGNGVLLMYDLGSAKMNAEMSIEFSESTNVQLADHIPLVEGSYIAAVEANLGKSLQEIRKSLQKIEITEM